MKLTKEKLKHIILEELNQCYPFPKTTIDKNVHRYLGEINLELISKAVQAMQTGNTIKLGQLMRIAQDQFDTHLIEACPSELTAPRRAVCDN